MKTDKDKIDSREISKTLRRYRLSILFISMLVTVLAATYAYFKPNIYSASSVVEVGRDSLMGGYGGEDIPAMAITPNTITTDAEIRLIKSRFLTNQALSSVDFAHRYYSTIRFKEHELYKDSPFDVNLTEGYNISFAVYPYNETQYRLEAEDEDKKTKEKWEYSYVHTYGEPLNNEHFSLVLTKKEGKTLENMSYRFVVLDDESAVESAREGVSVALSNKMSTILDITCEDRVPLRAQEFNNALAEAYITQSIYKKTREASKTLSFIDVQLEKINDNLKNSAVKLENFKKETSTVSLDSKAKSVMERLSMSESKLATISIEVGLLNSLYAQVKTGKNLETISMSGLTQGSGESRPGAQALASVVIDLQKAVMKVKILRTDYTEQYPEVIKLRRQISQMKKIIIDMIKNIKKNFDERKKLLEKSIANQTELMNQLPEDERIYGGLQRKFIINEKIYSYLLEKQAGTAIAKAAAISKNWIMDYALYPKEPIKPKRALTILIGLILGLILGIIQAFLRNFLDDTIKNDDDIKRGTNVSQLGIIPDFGKESDALKVFASPKSAAAEAFRNIRTDLQFMAPNRAAQVISVTSTVGGEGKTTISANLGGIFSLTKKKTIILNLDLRKPVLHQKFNLENSIGMSTLLSGHDILPEAIQHASYHNLDIISSGPVPPNPSELIEGDRMKEILDMLKKVYEVIILDTPPVGLVTDARTLMHLSDVTIYVLRSGVSKKASLKHIEKLSESDHIRGFSIVLNGVNIKDSGYDQGYGYYEEDK